MGHGIEFVDKLPDGLDFLFIGMPDGGGRILYRESAICPRVLEDSWAAYRLLVDDGGGGGPDDGERTSGGTVAEIQRDVQTVLALVSNG